MGIDRANTSGSVPWRLSAFETSGTFARISETITGTSTTCILQGIDAALSGPSANSIEASASTADGGPFWEVFQDSGTGIISVSWRGDMPLTFNNLFVAFCESTLDCAIGISAWGILVPIPPNLYHP